MEPSSEKKLHEEEKVAKEKGRRRGEEEKKKAVFHEQDDLYCLMEPSSEKKLHEGDDKRRDRDKEVKKKKLDQELETCLCLDELLLDYNEYDEPPREEIHEEEEEEEDVYETLDLMCVAGKKASVKSDLAIFDEGSSEESDDESEEDSSTSDEEEKEEEGGKRHHNRTMDISKSLRRSRSSRSRIMCYSSSQSDRDEGSDEELTSRVYTQQHQLEMWQNALCTGNIPDSFPGWTTRELSVLKQAVNDYMMTLEPFKVPVIVQSLPDKDTLESLLVMDLFSYIDNYSDDDATCSSGDEWEPELQLFLTLGKHVSFVKLFGLLKNAGIYSLGEKIGAKLLRVLMVSLVVCCAKKLSSTKSTHHLHLNQLTQYIQHLEIARTDSWIEVASRMIAA